MKYFQGKNKTLLSATKIMLMCLFIVLCVGTPLNLKNHKQSVVGINKVYAETADEASTRASNASIRAGKAASAARQAALVAQRKADESYQNTEGGVGDPQLIAVAQNAKRLAADASTAHRAAISAADLAQKAYLANDEALAIEQANVAELRAKDAENHNQAILGILANPAAAETDEAAVGYGGNGNTDSVLGCTIDWDFNVFKCVDYLLAVIAYFVIWLASWILGMSGLILDAAINYTLVNMSANLKLITGINIAWQAFRDIANMSFIFILLYIGISTIINGGSGKTNSMLRSVIIAAILINFSLFFTKVIIDISNILALGFYNGIVAQGDGSISTAFMQPLGLTSIFNISSSADALSTQGFQHIIIMGVGGTAFILTAAFTFLFAAGLFLIRYAVLIILLLLSPLAYAGQILPATQGQAKKWWESLMGQIIFAPAYMLMIWAVLKMVHNGLFGPSNNPNGFADALTSTGEAGQLAGAGGSSVGILVNFIIVIILLNACVIIAKTFAGRSGPLVNKAIGKAEGYARRWTTDVGGAVGRNIVGGSARSLGKKYDTYEAKMKDTAIGGGILKTLNKVSFGASGALNRAARTTVQDIENVKFGTGRTIADVRKDKEQREKLMTEKQKEFALERAIESGDKDKIEEVLTDVTPAQLGNLSASKIRKIAPYLNANQLGHVVEKVDKFSEKEKEEFIQERVKKIKDAQRATTEAAARIEEINRTAAGRALTIAEQEEIDALEVKKGEFRKSVRAVKGKEMEIIGGAVLRDDSLRDMFIDNMAGDEVDNIQKSGAFASGLKQLVKTRKDKPLKDSFDRVKNAKRALVSAGFAATPAQITEHNAAKTALAAVLSGMKDNDVAKLDKSILLNEDTIDILQPYMMNKFIGELTREDLKKIGDRIRRSPNHPALDYIRDPRRIAFFQ